MDFTELQDMLSSALRQAPRRRAYDLPALDDQNHASIRAGEQAMEASGLDRARPDIMQRLTDAERQVDVPLYRTAQPEPLAAQNRASLDAGLQGMHASGLDGTTDGADLMDRLYGARDEVVTPMELQKLQVAALQRRYQPPPESKVKGVSVSMGPVAMVDPTPPPTEPEVSASMGPVAMLGRTPTEPKGVSAAMGPVAMLGRTPEQGGEGTDPLAAGLKAMRVALPAETDPEILKKLESAKAGR